ncbi:hypothetical protein [Streptomyces sp. NPDC058861]|uniref:hypothetical protein n=1 Tax=Streptomyces sp. NPDC058861 TaxID=3346653 RepID=UPI0036C75E72
MLGAGLVEEDGGVAAGHLTAVPEEHADCEACYVMTRLATVTSRDLMHRCLMDDAVEAVGSTARFLIACMREVDQVNRFLTDDRGDTATGRPATA